MTLDGCVLLVVVACVVFVYSGFVHAFVGVCMFVCAFVMVQSRHVIRFACEGVQIVCELVLIFCLQSNGGGGTTKTDHGFATGETQIEPRSERSQDICQ
jgi:hypothetical protein